MTKNFTIIIPARFGSSRFPGKPLALIQGVPMIIRVWERACKVCKDVYIATDDDQIFNVSRQAGAKALLTSSVHRNGTERVAEAAGKIFQGDISGNEIIINIQGDEPLIKEEAIIALYNSFQDSRVDIATLVHKINDPATLLNPHRPKVVFDNNKRALYFSREAIPYCRNQEVGKLISAYQHIGVYGFRYSALKEIVMLPSTPLEEAEKLEQLRWLEHGYLIQCVESDYQGFGVDTPEDLERMNIILNKA